MCRMFGKRVVDVLCAPKKNFGKIYGKNLKCHTFNSLILRHESKFFQVKFLVSTHSACPCKNYVPECYQTPHECRRHKQIDAGEQTDSKIPLSGTASPCRGLAMPDKKKIIYIYLGIAIKIPKLQLQIDRFTQQ